MQNEGIPERPSLLHMLAHDLRTPLGGLATALDVMSYGSQLTPEDHSEALRIAKRQVGRLSQSIEILEILGLLDRPAADPVAVRLDQVLTDAWDRARAQAALPPQPLACEPCSVAANGELLLQLLHGLLRHGLSQHPADAPRLAVDDGAATVAFATSDPAPAARARLPLMLQATHALALFLGAELLFQGNGDAPGFRLRLKKWGPDEDCQSWQTPSLAF